MARASDGPKCPTPDEIDQLAELCNNQIGELEALPSNHPNPAGVAHQVQQFQRLIEILDWAGEQVNKRRAYSKKFQLKDKERTRLLKERLGEQYEDILEEAKSRANDKLFEEVANAQPDADDVSSLFEKE